jgi:hypothetical protein
MRAGPEYAAGIVQVPVITGPPPPAPVVAPPPAPVVVIPEPPAPVVEPPVVVVPIWSPPAPEVSPPVSFGEPLLLLPQAANEPHTTQPQKDRSFMANLELLG